MSDSSSSPYRLEELSEWLPSHPKNIAEVDLLHAKQDVKKQGRPKWQPQWSRIVSVDDDDDGDIRIFPIHIDIQL